MQTSIHIVGKNFFVTINTKRLSPLLHSINAEVIHLILYPVIYQPSKNKVDQA